MQIPQPLHNSSLIIAFVSSPSIMHSLPDKFTGQNLIHSNWHFLELHSSLSNDAILLTKVSQFILNYIIYNMVQIL